MKTALSQPKTVLVSACLLGQCVRYDGKNKPIDLSTILGQHVKLIAICPECAGGLSTPREPCEIEMGKSAKDVLEGLGRVLSCSGVDCTAQYKKGAQICLQLAKKHKAQFALLKEKSPACATSLVYDGHFNANTKSGRGVAAELLSQAGLELYNEKQIEKLMISLEKS